MAASTGYGMAAHRVLWWSIVVAVVALHGLAIDWLADHLVPLDARSAGAMTPMQAASVRELRPTEPPRAPPAPRTTRKASRKPTPGPATHVAEAPAEAASQAMPAEQASASAPALAAATAVPAGAASSSA